MSALVIVSLFCYCLTSYQNDDRENQQMRIGKGTFNSLFEANYYHLFPPEIGLLFDWSSQSVLNQDL